MRLAGPLARLAAATAGGAARQRLRRAAIMAVAWATAVMLVLAAFVLGLIAAYLGLRRVPFDALEAVAILAAALLATAILVVGIARLAVARRRRRAVAGSALATLPGARALGGIEPAHLLIAAFVTGVAVELLGARGRR